MTDNLISQPQEKTLEDEYRGNLEFAEEQEASAWMLENAPALGVQMEPPEQSAYTPEALQLAQPVQDAYAHIPEDVQGAVTSNIQQLQQQPEQPEQQPDMISRVTAGVLSNIVPQLAPYVGIQDQSIEGGNRFPNPEAMQGMVSQLTEGIETYGPNVVAYNLGKMLMPTVRETPRAIIKGGRDSVQSVLNLAREIDASTGYSLGGIAFTDEDGNLQLIPEILGSEEFKKRRQAIIDKGENPNLTLPDLDMPKTTGGKMVKGMAQFLFGFKGAGRVLGPSNAPIGSFSNMMRMQTQAAMSDFAAFDGHEQNLSDFVQQFPSLQNPVTEFLATDKEDDELTQRLKNTVTGQIPDVMINQFIKHLRLMKQARKLKAQTGEETYKEAASKLETDARAANPDEVIGEAREMPRVMGNADDEVLVSAGKKSTPEDSLKAKVDEADKARLDEQVLKQADEEQGGMKVGMGDNEVYVNLARINTQDDVKEVIQQLANLDKAGIEKATRGVRSNKQTAAAAGNEDAWRLLTDERAPGFIPNAEKQYAMRQLWASSSEQFQQLAKAASENPTPENLYAFRRMAAVHSTIQREVIGVRTETARALQQWSMLAGGKKEQLKQMEDVLNAHGGIQTTKKLADAVTSLIGREGGERAIDKLARKTPFAATMDAINSYWINSILSGPKTHVVNFIGNGGVMVQSIVERAIAARIADATGSIGGVRIGEATAMMWGIRQAWRDAFRYAGEAFRTGEFGRGTNKLEGARINAISSEVLGHTSSPAFNHLINNTPMGRAIDMIGNVVNIPGRFLTAGDEFFKTMNYRAELWAQAFRQASEEVDRGVLTKDGFNARIADIVEKAPEDIRLKAQDMSAYNTFTNETGNMTKAFMKVREAVPGTRYFIPFINTPSNIMSYTMERTPLAPLLTKYRADIAAGGARRDMALAKISLGSMATLTFYDFALNGNMTGSGPKDHRQRTLLRRSGWQPYSIRVENGVDKEGKPQYDYIAYNRVDPVGILMGVAADLAEWQLNTDDSIDSDSSEAFAKVIFSVAENMNDKAYFRGISDVVMAMSDPKRYGERYVNRFAGSFVPTGVAEVARQTDPYFKHTTDFVSSVKSRLPYFSQDVPNRVDYWGRDISFSSGLGKIYDATSPIYVSTKVPEPIDNELIRLKYSPSHRNYLSVDGERVPLRNRPKALMAFYRYSGGTPANQLDITGLSNSQIRKLKRYGSHTAMEYLNKVVTGEHVDSVKYAAEDNEGKEKFIRDTMRIYHKAAQARVLREFPELMEISATIKQKKIEAEERSRQR